MARPAGRPDLPRGREHDRNRIESYADVVPAKAFRTFRGSCLSPKDEIAAVEMAIGVEKSSVRMYEEVARLTMTWS